MKLKWLDTIRTLSLSTSLLYIASRSIYDGYNWPVLISIGVPTAVFGLRLCLKLWQEIPLQPRRYQLQRGNGRQVPFTNSKGTRWLSLQNIAPFLHFKSQSQRPATAQQRGLLMAEWIVRHHLYQQPRIISEARLRHFLQFVYDRQQETATCADAASRNTWVNGNPLQPRDAIEYHCMVGIAMLCYVIVEYKRSKILTRSPHWAIQQIKALLPRDGRVIEV